LNPESVLFTDPELELLIQKNHLRFSSADELIEVCLVSIAATSHLIATHKEVHAAFDHFMFTNMEKMLNDKSQDTLVRQRAGMLCSFTLDTIY